MTNTKEANDYLCQVSAFCQDSLVWALDQKGGPEHFSGMDPLSPVCLDTLP